MKGTLRRGKGCLIFLPCFLPTHDALTFKSPQLCRLPWTNTKMSQIILSVLGWWIFTTTTQWNLHRPMIISSNYGFLVMNVKRIFIKALTEESCYKMNVNSIVVTTPWKCWHIGLWCYFIQTGWALKLIPVVFVGANGLCKVDFVAGKESVCSRFAFENHIHPNIV
jgi:hypothetical protein